MYAEILVFIQYLITEVSPWARILVERWVGMFWQLLIFWPGLPRNPKMKIYPVTLFQKHGFTMFILRLNTSKLGD